MADVDAFREEARRWLVANAPPAMRKPLGPGEDLCWGGRKTRYPPDVTRWLDVMAERGWTAPRWPREYGGGGRSELGGTVRAREMPTLGLRPPLIGSGLTVTWPLVLQVGSEGQRRRRLPPSWGG